MASEKPRSLRRKAPQRLEAGTPNRAAALNRNQERPAGRFFEVSDLQCHKAPGLRAAIEARGAELRFLPPYSPDLNPIEQVFAKLKNLVRTAAPRDVETLWNTIGHSLGRFSAAECANYIANSGYPRMM